MTERFVTPYPLPTPRQRELLTLLIEECAEITKEACKWLRFGEGSIDIEAPGEPTKARMSREIGDLGAVYDNLWDAGMIDHGAEHEGRRAKHRKIKRFLQSEPDPK